MPVVPPPPSETVAAPGGERLVSVEVVVPSGVFWAGDARSVTVPSVQGTLGILARHEPVAASLAAGRVRLRTPDRPTAELRIGGGFVVVDHDAVTILADDATWVPAR
ncbi:ATP synthase F1 subunit epsilon [Cellulosimicrobium composti]|uniref:ATP synthase epsilon chain n=1 Tax=Cellulosimicrobium composti TaxID=2672572 RepID=A0ABX0B5T1_9MICO|nr:ATP synthase F1 subunit epsilon [Cellulosimicrobium composti]NDO88179.1 ATP synthase F1 subunit epsilon [Cellulosimicrobium composti]TWG83372.1 F-type H+-transporting ATPase subunit epsilon [Cellulosimicrobium cellulans J34]SMF17161.1 F-type H+-transporting ATPase subunit epsilon [Cellulosimicrobium cellulans J1]